MHVILAMILVALPGISQERARVTADALHHAIAQVRRETKAAIDPAVVVSIAFFESRFDASVCRDETNGSSSRGLMQVNVPRSRCGDGQRLDLYDARRNAYAGVRIYAAWMRATRHLPEALRRYSGGSSAYAREVLGRAVTLQRATRRK